MRGPDTLVDKREYDELAETLDIAQMDRMCLRADNERLERQMSEWLKKMTRLIADLTATAEENERLRGALEGVRDNCTTLKAAILIAREALEGKP